MWLKIDTKILHLMVLLAFLFVAHNSNAQLVINELQASNNTTIADNFLEYDDWIEIYNTSASSINLAGYFLSDDINDLTKYQIPATNANATTIAANGYLLFWADNDEVQGVNHSNFKLSASGETVFLVNPDGVTIVDSLTYQPLSSNQTFKRLPDGSNNLIKSLIASPGNTNNNDFGLLDPPVFSVAPGVYNSAQTVALSATNGATIYYTTNGADPDTNSTVYTSPIIISQSNTTIKAMAVQSGFASSEVVSAVYFTNTNHTLPIVNISINQDFLFDDSLGIYTVGTNGTLGGCNTTANWWNDTEYPAHITLFEKDGTVGFNEIAAVEISGGCSRNKDKKAINVGFKSTYGNSKLKYKLFENSDLDTYDGFKLRAGGSNTDAEFTNDALVQQYIKGQLDIDQQHTRPVVLYLNGYYWGLYFIRDRMNTGYVETYHPKYKDLPIDMVKNPFSNVDSANVYYWVYEKVMSGSKTPYYNLIDFIENNNLNITSNYEYVKTQIDMDSFIDYIIPFIFYDKFDWPANNLKVWKAGEPNSKWRWMMFDMEWIGRNGVESPDVLYNLLVSNNPNQLMHVESTSILRALFKSDEFKYEFIQRTNTYINSVWEPNRVQQIADNFNNEIQSEVPLNHVKWSDNWDYPTFQANKNLTVDYITTRPPYWRNMIDNILNVSGRITITYNFDNTTNGRVLTNSNFFTIPENYSTTYHQSVPLWIHAVPKPGYRFVEWQGISNTTTKFQQSFYSGFNSNTNLSPIFEPALDVVINEIHYNPLGISEAEEFIELYNPDDKAKPLFGYQFNNGVEFTFPENTVINPGEYVVIAKDASLYTGNGYQVFQWHCGSLNNDGEMVFFSNPANEVIDSVRYNDNIDWDQNADGLGYSLALIQHTQNNHEPSAWASQVTAQTTPGTENKFCSTMLPNHQKVDVSCYGANDGFIEANVSGGTTPFIYSWSTGDTTSTIQNLSPGVYTLTIYDFYGCEIVNSFQIDEPLPINASFTVNDANSINPNGGSIQVLSSGGMPAYAYNWSNGTSNQNLNNISAGNYSVSITDGNGCSEVFNQLMVENICTPTLIQQNNPIVASQIYQVAQFIQSNGVVQLNEQVSFKANNYIELKSDFEVVLGAEFEATIEGCQ